MDRASRLHADQTVGDDALYEHARVHRVAAE
jgi:hypothetical protein